MGTRAVTTNRRDSLFDFLAVNKTVTKSQMERYLGVEPHVVDRTLNDLRAFLADSDMNVVAVPNGWKQEWLYSLTGDLATAEEWINNRLGDSETRLNTINSVMRSVMNATSGATKQGKRARLIHKTLDSLLAQLEHLDSVGGATV